jgi:hypothetical protein
MIDTHKTRYHCGSWLRGDAGTGAVHVQPTPTRRTAVFLGLDDGCRGFSCMITGCTLTTAVQQKWRRRRMCRLLH